MIIVCVYFGVFNLSCVILIIIQQFRWNLTKTKTYLLLILTLVSGIKLYRKLTFLRYKNHVWYLKLHAFYRDCFSCKNPDSVLKRNIPSHNTSSCYLYSRSKKNLLFSLTFAQSFEWNNCKNNFVTLLKTKLSPINKICHRVVQLSFFSQWRATTWRFL